MKNLLIIAFIMVQTFAFSQRLLEPISYHLTLPLLTQDGIFDDQTIHVYMVKFDDERDAHMAFIDNGTNNWTYIVEDLNDVYTSKVKWFNFKKMKQNNFELHGQPKATYFQSPIALQKYMLKHGYEFVEVLSYIEKYRSAEEWWSAWVFKKIEN